MSPALSERNPQEQKLERVPLVEPSFLEQELGRGVAGSGFASSIEGSSHLTEEEQQSFEGVVDQFHERLRQFMKISSDEPLEIQIERKIVELLDTGGDLSILRPDVMSALKVDGGLHIDLNRPAIIEALKRAYIEGRWYSGTLNTYALLDCFIEPLGIQFSMLDSEIAAVTEERINKEIERDDLNSASWHIDHVIKRYKMPFKISKEAQKGIGSWYYGPYSGEFREKYKEYFV